MDYELIILSVGDQLVLRHKDESTGHWVTEPMTGPLTITMSDGRVINVGRKENGKT